MSLKVPAILLAGVFLLLAAYPYLELVFTSLQDGGAFTLSHYTTALSTSYLLYEPLKNSLLVGVATGIIATAAGVLLAWLVARTDLPGRRWIGVFVMIPQIIPSFQLASSWVIIFTGAGVFQTLFGMPSPVPTYGAVPLIVVQSLHVVLFSFLGVTGALSALDPTLEEAAEVAGLRRLQILWKITFPVVLPAILGAFLLTFANCIESLGAPLLLGMPAGFQVLTSQIYELSTSPPVDFGAASVLAILLGVIAVVVLMLNLKLLARGSYVTVTGKAGGRGSTFGLGIWRWPLAALVWAGAIAGSIVPLAALVLVSLLRSWGRGYGLDNLTLDHFTDLFSRGDLAGMFGNAILLGLATGVLVVAFGLLVGYGTVRFKTHWGAALDRLSYLTYATPGLVVGLGFVLAFSHPPINLYNTWWILLGAYFVRFGGLGVRNIVAKMRQISAELEEAGQVVGLSRLRILTAIAIPLMKQALGSTMLLIFINVVKEISATSILAGQNVQTLAYMAFLRYTEGDYTTGSAISVLMVALALIGSAMIARWSSIGKKEMSS